MRRLCLLVINYRPFNAPELELSAKTVKECVATISALKGAPAKEQPQYGLRDSLVALTSEERDSLATTVDVSSVMLEAINVFIVDRGVNIDELEAQNSRLGLFSIINDEFVCFLRISNDILAECYRIEHGMK